MTEAESRIKDLALSDVSAAHTLLFSAFYPALVRHAGRIISDAHDAENIAMDTLACALREPKLFDPEFRISSWLYRVATNRSLNHKRDRRRRERRLEHHAHEATPSEPPDPELILLERQARSAFWMLTGRLSANHSEILRLRHVDDLSYLEIAERLGVQLGTVMSRLNRAHGNVRLLVDANRELREDLRLSF